MSATSKSRSKDKKTGNEPLKTSSKSSIHVNAGGSVPSNGYNPLLGTFHTVDTAALSSLPVHVNGRYQTIEETGDLSGNTFGAGVECDSVSNNGSWSGESEDHKDKSSNQPMRQEVLHGTDNDKREKIRQKNEKKHQRQRERRAQELHERCSGYLMSRKLEALSQQLVGMGFPQERSTMALILNEGRVEESVAWLFDVGEEADESMEQNLDSGTLKIDISEELARIAEMEIRCKCSRQEVERAVVACEGDLEKAEESLKLQKEDPPLPIKQEAIDYPPILGNGKLPVASNQELMKMQQKPAPPTTVQHQRSEREFNNSKPVHDPGNRNLQSLERIQPKLERAKPQQISVPAEKRYSVATSSPASFSVSPALQASIPPTSAMAPGSELKNQLSRGSLREPVMVMQRPQSINAKMPSSTSVGGSSSVGPVMGWSPNNAEMLVPNGFIPRVYGTRNASTSTGTVGTDQVYSDFSYQHARPFVPTSKTVESLGTSRENGLWSRTSGNPNPTVAAPSSLGLFSGLGAQFPSGSSSHLDWNSGSSVSQLDYTSIDWSLNRESSMSGPSGLWSGISTSMQYETPSPRYDMLTSKMGMDPGIQLGRLHDSGVGSSETSSNGSGVWASPFEERDIFTFPRQYVSSPSL